MRDASLLEFVLDQLSTLEGVDARRMFGGHGLYLDGEFFGMVWKGRAWFRTDGRSRERYRARGAKPFPMGGAGAEKSYWSVPEDVLEDAGEFAAWARAAAATPRPAAQRRAKRAGSAKRRRT